MVKIVTGFEEDGERVTGRSASTEKYTFLVPQENTSDMAKTNILPPVKTQKDRRNSKPNVPVATLQTGSQARTRPAPRGVGGKSGESQMYRQAWGPRLTVERNSAMQDGEIRLWVLRERHRKK